MKIKLKKWAILLIVIAVIVTIVLMVKYLPLWSTFLNIILFAAGAVVGYLFRSVWKQ